MLNVALSAVGITLRAYRPGAHRTACPECKKPKDQALKVDISDDGAVWYCHRCHWTGNTSTGIRHEGEPRRHHRDEPKPTTLAVEYRKLFFREAKLIGVDDIGGRYFTYRCCARPASDHVRLHPGVWHSGERREIPAILSLITNVLTGEPQSLHMTFLRRDGSGKADIERPKMYLAGHAKAGGCVRLDPDDAVEMGLIISEGIETALTYRLEFSPIWAALDAGNIASFPLLNGIEGLTVLVDNDDAGRAAFEKVATRWRAVGKECIGIMSPVAGEDINDAVTA
jgi:putative DNA primase/helicase